MGYPDKIAAVSRMQAYIAAHLAEEMTPEDLSRAAGYSKFHAMRLFKELTGRNVFEYIRALRLTQAARALSASGRKVVDVALETGFASHDGFTRAFSRQFGLAPQKYRRETPAVPYFIGYPVAHSRKNEEGTGICMEKERVAPVVTVTAVERPARKLILLRAKKASGGDYFAFCEEMGCEWEGFFNSIPEKMTTAAQLTLPDNLVLQGTSDTAAGIEVPLDYAKPLPTGYDTLDLPPCTMLFFRGAPFENPDDYRLAIGIVERALASYRPGDYGWRYAYHAAPRFHFGTNGGVGALMAVPVEKAD